MNMFKSSLCLFKREMQATVNGRTSTSKGSGTDDKVQGQIRLQIMECGRCEGAAGTGKKHQIR